MDRVSPVAGAGAIVALLGLMALGTGPPQRRGGTPAEGAQPAGAASPTPPDRERPSAAARALLEGRPMDLNRAARDDLMLLPRIGPTLAERIDDDRRAHGPYGRLADLSRVSGVGAATVAGLRPLACAGEDCPTGGSQVENEAEP